MDTVRFARGLRALRRRRGWRQDDLAAAARLSRGAIARAEQGHADAVTVRTLEAILAPLGARLSCRIDWNGEAFDRLLDASHAGVVERVLGLLREAACSVATEVSFNIAGERGSVDVLGWHPPTCTILVVEAKSVVPDIQAMLATLDRKSRLVSEGGRAAARRGRRPDGASSRGATRGNLRFGAAAAGMGRAALASAAGIGRHGWSDVPANRVRGGQSSPHPSPARRLRGDLERAALTTAASRFQRPLAWDSHARAALTNDRRGFAWRESWLAWHAGAPDVPISRRKR